MSTPKTTGTFTPVEGFAAHKFELIVELPKLPGGDGQSLAVVLTRNVETGTCWGTLEYELRGRTEDFATFSVSPAHFCQLTDSLPWAESLQQLVQSLAQLDPHDLVSTQRLRDRAALLVTR